MYQFTSATKLWIIYHSDNYQTCYRITKCNSKSETEWSNQRCFKYLIQRFKELIKQQEVGERPMYIIKNLN